MKNLSIVISTLSVVLACVFGFLFFNSSESLNFGSSTNTELTTSLQSMYEAAKSSGYEKTYDSWETELETGRVQIRLLNSDVEWKYEENNNWIHMYSSKTTNATWYLELIDGDVVEYDQYYKVIFNSNNNTENTIIDVIEGSILEEPTQPTYSLGFEFLGWYLEDVLYNFSNKVTSSMNLNALWEGQEFTLSYDSMGGDLINNQIVGYNSQFTLVTPSRDGYTFNGWYLNDVLMTSGVWTYNYDVNLIAKWTANTYSINFNTNSTSVIYPISVQTNQNYTLPTPIKTGYTFNGWYLNDELFENGEWNLTSSIQLEASWTLDVYKLSFNTNGAGVLDAIDISYGENFELPTLEKTSYIFEGWYYGNEKVASGVWTYSSDVTLVAKWSAQTYIITFNTNSTTEISMMSVQSGEVFILPTPYKSGSVFEGWYLNDTIIQSGVWTLDQNITLEAKWSTQVYYIHFNTNSTLIVDSLVVEFGQAFSLPTISDDRMDFIGWFNGSEQVRGGTYYYSYDLTLDAKWSADGSIVTFNANGGETVNSDILQFGFSYTLPTPYKRGFTFLGWRYGSVLIETEGYWGYETNLTLVASWELTDYYITYIMDDGTNNELNSEIFTVETEMLLENPFKSYYSFEGWYLDEDFETEILAVKDLVDNMAIYAKFDVIHYEITYVLNGTQNEENPFTYAVTEGAVSLENPIKEDSAYTHWYLDSGLTHYVPTLNESVLALLDSDARGMKLYAYYGETYGNHVVHSAKDHASQTRNFLYFGTYPQTIVSDELIIEQLSSLEETNENGYYEINGVEYAKQTSVYSSKTFSNGVVSEEGVDYFFKVEPIRWKILYNTNGTIKVVTDNIIDGSLYYENQEERIIDGETIYPNNYEHSDVRKWLNDEFYNTAFTEAEQGAIATSLVDNSAKSTSTVSTTTNIYASNDTYDKIYMLSNNDCRNTSYTFISGTTGDDDRAALCTDYALAVGIYASNTTACTYWLMRSPGNHSSTAVYNVYISGSIISYYGVSNTAARGIRPAFTFAY